MVVSLASSAIKVRSMKFIYKDNFNVMFTRQSNLTFLYNFQILMNVNKTLIFVQTEQLASTISVVMNVLARLKLLENFAIKASMIKKYLHVSKI